MQNVFRPTKTLFALFVLTLVVSLSAAACGSGGDGEISLEDDAANTEESDADTGSEADPDTDGTTDPDSESGDAGSGLTGEFLVTDASPDLISAQPAPIIELITVDDQTIGVRYENGSEPCSLANVTVTESDTEIVVELVTGLHPNAAAMSCIAQVIDYEIQVTLDAPVGDRQIVAGG